MNYLLRTNNLGTSGRNKNPFSLGRILGVFIVAIIALWWIFFTPDFLRTASHNSASTITSTATGVEGFFSTIITYFRSKHALEKENETLRDKLFAQGIEMVNFELLKKQNAELKEVFGRSDTKKQIVAAIIRNVAASPYGTFLIDGGKRAGIVPGDVVLVRGSIPVGYVSKVFEQSAEVTMYSAKGETIEGVVTFREKKADSARTTTDNGGNTAIDTAGSSDSESQNASGTGRLRTLYVTLTGNGGGNFLVHLTKDVEVPSGASIAMPGIASRLLATVYESEVDAAGGSRVLYALSPVNMLHEELVYVEPHQE